MTLQQLGESIGFHVCSVGNQFLKLVQWWNHRIQVLQVIDLFIKNRQLIGLAGGNLDGFFLQLGFHLVRKRT